MTRNTANKRNAAKSTGPKTPEGKARASRNSTTHGLSGSHIVLSTEDPAAFDDMLAELHEDWAPASAQERQLVREIAENRWRIDRIRRIEAETFEAGIATGASLAESFHSRGPDFDRIRRYEITCTRAWQRAINLLDELQAARRAAEPTDQEIDNTLSEAEEQMGLPGIGFVMREMRERFDKFRQTPPQQPPPPPPSTENPEAA